MSMTKRCPGCCGAKQVLPIASFSERSRGGHESRCKRCRAAAQKLRDDAATARRAEADAELLREQEARARRIASDTDPLRLEDFDDEYDVGVGNVDSKAARRASSRASREKRQEFNAEMGSHAEDLKRAAASAPSRGGDVLSVMSDRSGSYIAKLAEQERRFQNRRLARTISLAQASEALNLQAYKQIAAEFFGSKIRATGCATRAPRKPAKRTVCLLLSDLHIGAELSSLDEPMPFGAIEEARRLEYVMRETIDYKPQHRGNSKLALLWNGDVIEGQLLHQLGAGAPLAEQKAAFWSYSRQMMAEFSHAFEEVEVHWQSGNHGRDKVRHPGRATWRKWDGHEFELGWALREMCRDLRNVTWNQPLHAVSKVNLHGATLCLTHADTEIKLGHPDKAYDRNARELAKINEAEIHGCRFDAFAFGHFHTGRVQYSHVPIVWNPALIPPNGHARSEGYVGEPCGQMLWEAVEGHPVGDVRMLKVDHRTDRDERLGTIIKPFRFPA